MSRLGWSLIGLACGVASTTAAIYFQHHRLSRRLTGRGLLAKCLDCGFVYRYAHPALRLEALAHHQVRCPALAS